MRKSLPRELNVQYLLPYPVESIMQVLTFPVKKVPRYQTFTERKEENTRMPLDQLFSVCV